MRGTCKPKRATPKIKLAQPADVERDITRPIPRWRILELANILAQQWYVPKPVMWFRLEEYGK